MALDQLDQAKTWAMLPYLMAAAAELSWDEGNTTAARRLLDRATELVRLTGERWCEPEVMRLQARFMPDETQQPIGLLQRALDLARGQGAKLWELRIARDLGKRLLVAGEPSAALAVVAPICDGFDEAHGMPDFTELSALASRLRLTRPRPGLDSHSPCAPSAGP
jgi:hypothetical protein